MYIKKFLSYGAMAFAAFFIGTATLVAQSEMVWNPDNGDGTYKNPIIHADYSDPDAIRVGDYYYMTSSSFNVAPGLPILRSEDLVHWEIIGHAFDKQIPLDVFDKPQHGKGTWAPSLRHHDGEFYIYYGDPDFGIYMTKTDDPAGEWSPKVLVKAGKGLIDPCPLWDDDGKAYLVHAFAGSRAGIKSVLMVQDMKPDGTAVQGDATIVFDGHEDHPTIEGPKFYKRNDYYYIFAPGGGVTEGWQTVLRSKNVYGPYEDKVVLHQGNTEINGPHQGAWVQTNSGQDWFIHFQDKEAYGRIVHMQPMSWKNDWPVMGEDKNNDGIGEPVLNYEKPDVAIKNPKKVVPATSDEFNDIKTGLQWQWQANPEPYWMYNKNDGNMRLYAKRVYKSFDNLWDAPNLLLQKFPAPSFSATTKLTFYPHEDGEKVGLIIMGHDYSYVSLEQKDGKLMLAQKTCKSAADNTDERTVAETKYKEQTIYLRVSIKEGAVCNFSYSKDGEDFESFGESFQAVPGGWIGAKVGLFAGRAKQINDSGYADVDWFRISNNK